MSVRVLAQAGPGMWRTPSLFACYVFPHESGRTLTIRVSMKVL